MNCLPSTSIRAKATWPRSGRRSSKPSYCRRRHSFTATNIDDLSSESANGDSDRGGLSTWLLAAVFALVFIEQLMAWRFLYGFILLSAVVVMAFAWQIRAWHPAAAPLTLLIAAVAGGLVLALAVRRGAFGIAQQFAAASPLTRRQSGNRSTISRKVPLRRMVGPMWDGIAGMWRNSAEIPSSRQAAGDTILDFQEPRKPRECRLHYRSQPGSRAAPVKLFARNELWRRQHVKRERPRPSTGPIFWPRALIRQGIDQIFAYPGGASMPLRQGAAEAEGSVRQLFSRDTSKAAGLPHKACAEHRQGRRLHGNERPGCHKPGHRARRCQARQRTHRRDYGAGAQAVIGTDAFQETPIIEVCRRSPSALS